MAYQVTMCKRKLEALICSNYINKSKKRKNIAFTVGFSRYKPISTAFTMIVHQNCRAGKAKGFDWMASLIYSQKK